ncbi:MAG: acyltransferase [Terracidiphilus sp.]
MEDKRIPSLDGIRALSILFVVMGHAALTPGFPSYLGFLIHATFGVRIFFVVSGFLITTLLLKEREKSGRISCRGFYIRRAYRILPAAYTYLLVVTVLFWNSIPRLELLCSYTFLINNLVHKDRFLVHLWSLSVEEQFYLLWPFLLSIFFNKRKTILIWALALAPICRIIASASGNHEPSLYFPSVQDALAAGCLLAILWPKLDRWTATIHRWIVPIATGTLLLAWLKMPSELNELVVQSLLNIGIALCIYDCVQTKYRILNIKPVVWVGTISYSLYLWQQPFLQPGSTNPFTAFPLNILCAVALASMSRYLIEKPFLALRTRIRVRVVREPVNRQSVRPSIWSLPKQSPSDFGRPQTMASSEEALRS